MERIGAVSIWNAGGRAKKNHEVRPRGFRPRGFQRVKLASELHKNGQVYVLDEPSTGLHAKDIEKLLALLRKLVDEGNTVVMVEHRMELIAQADWIIDIGPEGGSNGGEVIFEGIPEDIVTCAASKTGAYLKNAIDSLLNDLWG